MLSFDLVWKTLRRGVRFGERRGLFTNFVYSIGVRESRYFIDDLSTSVSQSAHAKLSLVKASLLKDPVI